MRWQLLGFPIHQQIHGANTNSVGAKIRGKYALMYWRVVLKLYNSIWPTGKEHLSPQASPTHFIGMCFCPEEEMLNKHIQYLVKYYHSHKGLFQDQQGFRLFVRSLPVTLTWKCTSQVYFVPSVGELSFLPFCVFICTPHGILWSWFLGQRGKWKKH